MCDYQLPIRSHTTSGIDYIKKWRIVIWNVFNSPFSKEICFSNFGKEFISPLISIDCCVFDVTSGFLNNLRQWIVNFIISPGFSKHIKLPTRRWLKWIIAFSWYIFLAFENLFFVHGTSIYMQGDFTASISSIFLVYFLCYMKNFA